MAVPAADYRFARRPRWLLTHLLVVSLAALFVGLGVWQLQRLDERRATNAIVATRAALAAEPVGELVDPADADDALDDLRFRAATAAGTYRPGGDVVVRATQGGRTGGRAFSVLALAGGESVVVLRGFVAAQDDGTLEAPPPPEGEVEVEGVLIPRERLEGTFEQAVDDLVDDDPGALPVVVQAGAADGEALVPVPPPDLGDGPHLGYAVQWFLFAAVGVVGYPFLLRRRARDRGDVDVAA
jgi:surfeit locus 1 family protein